ncbi:MAG: DUF1178 family protein [Rhodospirillaceae bacterium]
MILYDLTCSKDHLFESWFRNSNAADKLIKAGTVVCPTCGSTKVHKAPMAPRIAKSQDGSPREKALVTQDRNPEVAAAMQKAEQALAEMRSVIEKNFENVGEKFPEEARRIHYGEAPGRAIYGDASPEESEALREEGIEIQAIPWKRRTNS